MSSSPSPVIRRATHAGSWYTKSASKLTHELTNWLSAVSSDETLVVQAGGVGLEMPVKGCRAIIAPHAGYSYSGETAAFAYRCVDVDAIKRVFVLGPSHHVYLDGCALSGCTEYETPIGPLPLDLEVIRELEQTGKFQKMDKGVDEAEHSIELHLPYIRHLFSSKSITLIPILVGSLSSSSESTFGALLSPYLLDPGTLFVISSDFCHWGTRFNYTFYVPPSPSHSPSLLPQGWSLTPSSPPLEPEGPQSIHESISRLDYAGMNAVAFSKNETAKKAKEEFKTYLAETRNTICGRHPIGVLLGACAALEKEDKGGRWKDGEMRWVRYARSGLVRERGESSVSYASAVLRVGGA